MSAKARGAEFRRMRGARHAPRADVRVGPIVAIPVLLAEYGLDPSLVLAKAGLDTRLFHDPENRVSVAALGNLLEICVQLTGCRHFGLLVGERFNADALGILGRLMGNCPTVRDALRMATLHLELQDRGAVVLMLDLDSSRAALGYSLFDSDTPAADQILDGAIAIHLRLLRSLCGPSWTPLRIHLSHSRPEKIAPLRKAFGARLEFDAAISAVEFESTWLDHPIAGADPVQYAVHLKTIESMESRQASRFIEQVRRAIYALNFTASASSANLAQLFDLQQRTLRRRLREEGTTVRELVGEMRLKLAHHLLRNTTLPVSEIAGILCYSDGTAFARAFRTRSNMSPVEWRARFR